MITGQENNLIMLENELIIPQDEMIFTDVIGNLGGSGWDVLGYTVDLSLAIIIFLWIVSIVWTLKDSLYRSSSLLFQVCSVILVALGTPIVGLPIYLAIRPLGYKYEREYWKMIMEGYKINDTTGECESMVHSTSSPKTQPKTTQSKKPRKNTTRTPRKRVINLEE